MNKKVVALVLACVLIFSTIVAGTLAYLWDSTDAITNTFSFGNVKIDLTETTGTNYKLLPGKEYAKNPTVKVEANSEPAWVFVKVEADANLSNFVDYSINAGDTKPWKELDGEDGVYYLEYTSGNAETYGVLTGDKVTVKDFGNDAGSTDMELEFTAYAIQKEGFTVTEAWTQIQTLLVP